MSAFFYLPDLTMKSSEDELEYEYDWASAKRNLSSLIVIVLELVLDFCCCRAGRKFRGSYGSLGWRCPRHFVPGYDRTVPPGHFEQV